MFVRFKEEAIKLALSIAKLQQRLSSNCLIRESLSCCSKTFLCCLSVLRKEAKSLKFFTISRSQKHRNSCRIDQVTVMFVNFHESQTMVSIGMIEPSILELVKAR